MERRTREIRVLQMEPSTSESEVLLTTEKFTLIAPTRGTVRVVMKGVQGLAEAIFEVELRAGRYEVVSLTVKPPPGEILNLDEVRTAKQRAQWVSDSIASAVWAVAADGTIYDSENPMPDDHDPLVNVMLTYTMAKASGREPIAAVAEKHSMSREVASQRIYRARLKGFLPPATRKGKA